MGNKWTLYFLPVSYFDYAWSLLGLLTAFGFHCHQVHHQLLNPNVSVILLHQVGLQILTFLHFSNSPPMWYQCLLPIFSSLFCPLRSITLTNNIGSPRLSRSIQCTLAGIWKGEHEETKSQLFLDSHRLTSVHQPNPEVMLLPKGCNGLEHQEHKVFLLSRLYHYCNKTFAIS